MDVKSTQREQYHAISHVLVLFSRTRSVSKIELVTADDQDGRKHMFIDIKLRPRHDQEISSYPARGFPPQRLIKTMRISFLHKCRPLLTPTPS